MTPEPRGRSALVVWLQLLGLLAAVAVFGAVILLMARRLKAGG